MGAKMTIEKFLIGIGIIGVFFLIVMLIDVNRFVIRNYEIKTGKVNKPYRFVVLSDLHNKQFGKNNKNLLKAIIKVNPHAVFIAGDMITAKTGKDMTATLEFLQNLGKILPVYYGQGNHEYRLELYKETYGEMLSTLQNGLKKAGIEQMKNTHVNLPDFGISIYGLEIERKYYKRFQKLPMEDSYINKLLGSPDQHNFSILIAHNPEYFEEYVKWGADLVLSGHVHGGLMRFPFLGGVISPAIRIFPKYDGGIFKKDGKLMILSRGLGTHTLPIRIFNPGELIVVNLSPSKNK